MPNPSYPATLPAVLIDFTENPNSTAIASPMDAGPAKQRRRFSMSWSRFQCQLMLSTTQRATFMTFWSDTCKCGAQAFDWVHPATGTATTFVFVADSPPKLKAIGGGYFLVSFEMEDRAA